MLRSLSIENFRAFQRFSMEGLGRVNLLVGTNNCGKTSVLEAISIAARPGDVGAIWATLTERNERSLGILNWEGEVEHLFRGRELVPGNAFSVRLNNAEMVRELTATLVVRERNDEVDVLPLTPLLLHVAWSGTTSVERRLALHGRGVLRMEPGRGRSVDLKGLSAVQFLGANALSNAEVIELFGEIVLTPEEDMIIEALRSVEPTIERIAAPTDERASMFVKVVGANRRIPIGSLGGGIWRMLGIALSLAKARGGILLIDEIDTGLHYSVMADMWRLVRDTAKRLDVQVFATTHSRDCYEALAEISRPGVTTDTEVSIQRIEKGKPKAVSFTEREIVIVAEDSIEVR